MIRVGLVLLAGVFGCEGCGGGEGPEGANQGTQQGSPSGGETPNNPEADPGPAPNVQVRGEVTTHGEVRIIVENHGDAHVSIASGLRLERVDDGFSEVDGVNLDLRADCESEAPDCIELISGAALHPPQWLGTIGDAQCICARCGPADPGEYRFVAQTCNRAHRIEGEVFRL